MVVPDETGWKIDGHLQWLWIFASRDTTVYAIQPGRGFPQAAAVLSANYDGVLVHDGWAPYRHFTHATHQSCVAHLLRRGRTLHDDHPRAAFAPQVEHILQRALALRDRRDARIISEHGAAAARGRLIQQLLHTLTRAGRVPAMERFTAHLSVELPGIFTFLFEPDVDATNWRAEQALRPAVVTRKVCGGNRSPRGADTQQILASVVRTARQRDLDVTDVFVALLRAPQPTIPFALQEDLPVAQPPSYSGQRGST
jgi:transposase